MMHVYANELSDGHSSYPSSSRLVPARDELGRAGSSLINPSPAQPGQSYVCTYLYCCLFAICGTLILDQQDRN